MAFGGWVLGLAPDERVDLLQRLAKALDSAQGARLRGVQVHPRVLFLLLGDLGLGFRAGRACGGQVHMRLLCVCCSQGPARACVGGRSLCASLASAKGATQMTALCCSLPVGGFVCRCMLLIHVHALTMGSGHVFCTVLGMLRLPAACCKLMLLECAHSSVRQAACLLAA